MDKSDIIRAVMGKEYQISPEAVELIKSSNSPESLLKYVLSTVNDSVIVIGAEHIDFEGFAAYGRALKLTYAENGENPGFETSTGNHLLMKYISPLLKEGEILSGTTMLSSRSQRACLLRA